MQNIEIKSDVEWDQLFMEKVYLIAKKSKDPRTKIGAVLVKNNVAILEGFNGFPRKVKDYRSRYEDREIKYKLVVHAEANSVFVAAKLGISIDGATCYTQGMPCNECCKALLQGGIKEIVIHSRWPSMGPKWEEAAKWSELMCDEAGIKVRQFYQKLGITAYTDGKVIMV